MNWQGGIWYSPVQKINEGSFTCYVITEGDFQMITSDDEGEGDFQIITFDDEGEGGFGWWLRHQKYSYFPQIFGKFCYDFQNFPRILVN